MVPYLFVSVGMTDTVLQVPIAPPSPVLLLAHHGQLEAASERTDGIRLASPVPEHWKR
jgi:hypothetical protein